MKIIFLVLFFLSQVTLNQALKEMPLFSIYLNSYNYSGAIDCVNKASGYLTMSEQKAILNAIPKP